MARPEFGGSSRESLVFRLAEVAEDLGPPFLEVSVPLQSALQHCLYSVLGFGPCQRRLKRSEGIEEPVGRRQRNLVDEILRGGDGSSIEGGDPPPEGFDEALQSVARKCPPALTLPSPRLP